MKPFPQNVSFNQKLIQFSFVHEKALSEHTSLFFRYFFLVNEVPSLLGFPLTPFSSRVYFIGSLEDCSSNFFKFCFNVFVIDHPSAQARQNPFNRPVNVAVTVDLMEPSTGIWHRILRYI